ncbi:MAG: hypothetical protein OSB19_09445 [Opitutaceae bacterium]|nr:hypothetical protein [Opitutaceae bacterium]
MLILGFHFLNRKGREDRKGQSLVFPQAESIGTRFADNGVSFLSNLTAFESFVLQGHLFVSSCLGEAGRNNKRSVVRKSIERS